jgi:O-antigen ligase
MILAASNQSASRARSVLLIVIGVVLALALSVGQALSPQWATAALAAMLLTTLAVCKMEAAIVFFTLTVFMIIGPLVAVTGRFGHSDGLYTSEFMLGLLALVWGARLVFLTIRNKRFPLDHNPINLPLFCLIGSAIFAFIAAQFTWDINVPTEHKYLLRQLTEIGLLCMPITVYLMVSSTIKDVRWAKAVYYAVLAVGVVGFLMCSSILRMPDFFRPQWRGLLPVPLISFLYAYVILRDRFDLKLLMVGTALVVLVVFQFTGLEWAVMWLSTGISLCVISWYRSKRLSIALACAVLLLLALRPGFLTGIYETETASRSFERIDLWSSIVRITMTRPLWGIGPGNFYPYYSYRYALEYGTINVSSPHSNYFQILIEYGFLGLICFVWFIIACVRMLKNSLGLAKDNWQRTFLLGVNGHFAGMAVIAFLADYLIPTSANGGLATFSITVYTWLLLGVAASLRTHLLREKAAEEPAPNAQVVPKAGAAAVRAQSSA